MKIDQAVLHQMAIALGVAILGIAGIYSTFAQPEIGPGPNAVSMITVAAADRAGATVSSTDAPVRHMATWVFK
jgi:hypothetical protein